jgi:hypothetical protein
MKLLRFACLVVVSFALSRNVFGQDFVNLNFEQSTVVSSNYDDLFGFYYGTANVPGWTGYTGTNQVTTILYNSPTLGSAGISVVGPAFTDIQGQFTLLLQPGQRPQAGFDGQFVGASMSQSGLVPAFAQSLQFKAQTSSGFSVSLGGQTLSLVQLGTGANYTLYGADISSFAGEVETLTITALPLSEAAPNYFDSIVFSPSAVPEPSTSSLFGICILFLCWRMKRPYIASDSN